MNSSLSSTVTLGLGALCLALVVVYYSNRRFLLAKLAPGPPGLPLIGNIWRLPVTYPWLKLAEWKEQYGDLVFLHGLGKSVLVLNTMEAINDLLDRRGRNYTHRPEFFVAGELFKLTNSMVLMTPGKDMTLQRKLAHSALNPEVIKRYHRMQEDLTALLLLELLETPLEFRDHVRMTAGRLVMAITYGLSAQEADAKYIDHAEKTMHRVTAAMVPGKYIVDIFPSLRHILRPWLPFVTFWEDGEITRLMIEKLVTEPFLYVKKQMAEGTARPSFTQDVLSNFSVPEGFTQEEFEHVVRWTAGTMYAAGGESTYATVIVFLMLMAMYPEKQRVAREHIFHAIGHERLPTVADINGIPYVLALVKEVARWQTVLPLSIPRCAAKDNEYKGCFIPAGTTVIPNIWGVSLETNDKGDPKAFMPERFLDESAPVDPYNYIFGFGRRVCPGRAFAEGSLFVLIASVLACFEISPAKDEDGKTIPIIPSFATGLVSYPLPFRCDIRPLSDDRASMIRTRAANRLS